MEILHPPSLQVGTLLWQQRSGALALTIACKATFQLEPNIASLLTEGDALCINDSHWNDDPSRSVYAPSDLVPFKPGADVVLVGSVFAPGGTPTRSVIARMLVGSIDKSIEAVCERYIGQDGSLQEGARFAKMPLRYERAAGGPDTPNPVGIRADVRDAQGRRPLPTLQPPGTQVETPDQIIPSIGFGPTASTWPGRREHAGALGAPFPPEGMAFVDLPISSDLNPSHFSAAPLDQQLEVLRSDERIILENLHPEHARLVTSLPGLVPRVVIHRGRRDEVISVRPDLLWIDTDRAICTLTFRGQFSLKRRDEVDKIVASIDSAGAADRGARSRHELGTETLIGARSANSVLPFGQAGVMSARSSDEDEAIELSADEIEDASEPRLRPASLPVPVDLGAMSLDVSEAIAQTMMLSKPASANSSSALPFASVTNAAAPVSALPLPVPTSPLTPPAYVVPASAAVAPPTASSPWAVGGFGGATVPDKVARIEPLVSAPPGGPAAKAGVLAASNAARGEEPAPREISVDVALKPKPSTDVRSAPKEFVKLIFFDPACIERVRGHEQWRVLLAELELRRLERGASEDAEDEQGKARRDVFEVLLRGESIGVDRVRFSISAGSDEDGRFEAPLVLISGELELPFDELSVLKATVAAMRPLSSGDKRLSEVLDGVDDLSKTPWLEGTSGVSGSSLDRVREAFSAAKRAVGLEYVESHTERMLLERRCYQTKTLWGKKWIRGLLRGGGAGDVPVYLPEALRDELPMFKRFRVKIIAEADMREDQYETSPYALRVVGLGRILAGVG